VIKLLVVDDSPLMRRLMIEIFTAAGDFEVAVARSGQEALDQLTAFAPDVVTLDVHMPDMNGLACLDRIMVLRPCPVVMVSSLTAAGADETLEAMALGAVDFVAKPRGALSMEIERLAPELVDKVRQASTAQISRATRLLERVRARTADDHGHRSSRNLPSVAAAPRTTPLPPDGLVVIGCSTGGPPALDAVLGRLPADFTWPIVVAQHMPASFTGPLARRLDKLCALEVCEVSAATRLLPGHVYVARGDADMIISRRASGLVALAAPSDPALYWHPSVDRLVASAMKYLAPESLIGVLMTGMGTDGAKTMADLKDRGGQTIAESADSAVVWGMPGALVGSGGASIVAPLERIAGELTALLER
jgi:two-component system chemotaxis response regulator CheB